MNDVTLDDVRSKLASMGPETKVTVAAVLRTLGRVKPPKEAPDLREIVGTLDSAAENLTTLHRRLVSRNPVPLESLGLESLAASLQSDARYIRRFIGDRA